MTERFEELRGERDAEELEHLASALDPSSAPGPRPEFVARLRALVAAERPRPRAWQWFFPTPRLAAAWAALLVVAVATSALFAARYETRGPTAIGAQRVVLVSATGFLTYDPVTLQQRERVDVPAPQPWVVLAPDQRRLVFTFGTYIRTFRVYDLTSEPDRPRFRDIREGLSSPHQFALSKDGTRAYVRDGDAVKIVDLAGLKVVGAIPTPGIEDSPVYLAPDDRRLFQFLPQGGLVVYDVAERRISDTVPVDLKDPYGLSASARVAFSPDGSRLYAVGSTGSPTGPVRVLVLDTATLEKRADAFIDPNRLPVLSRAQPDLGERLAAVLRELVPVAAAKELGTVTQVALSPDGRRLYAARGSAGRGVLVIDAERLVGIGLVETAREAYALQLTPDGGRLFVLATPPERFGEATLLSLDTRSYAVVASASPRNVSPEAAVIVLRQ